jgi:hypothetical protein
VARTDADKNPTLELKSLSPKRKVMRSVINPVSAEGSRLANSESSPKKRIDRLTIQKKRGGFSA